MRGGLPAHPDILNVKARSQELNWDVRPDGRFVMVKADPATTRQFQVVMSWFEEVRGRLGD